MMLLGVSKSGSPISRWMTDFPLASSCLARASTLNAVSVPRRDIAEASLDWARVAIGLLRIRNPRAGEIESPRRFHLKLLTRGARLQLRPMAPADVQSVGHVLAAAYSEVIVRLQGREWLSRYRARTREELEAQRSFFPSGCIVAESGGRIAGAIFARKWGSLGWFSALAVHPELQGRGIGKALAEAAIGELQRAGCIVVGMETWPNAADYTAMYIKMGFEPVGMTAVLMSPAERDWPRPDGCSVHLLDELPAGLAMQANQSARDICAKALAGMDV